MSVLIKNMKMPENCWQCPCFDDMGHICNLDNDCRDVYDGRPDWCPLVELPEKHGRLIDANTAMKPATDVVRERLIESDQGVFCTGCKTEWDYCRGVPVEVYEYKFCPYCGAKWEDG